MHPNMKNFAYVISATAPTRDVVVIENEAENVNEATAHAREEAADMLGVRAEHVVLSVYSETPNF